MLRWPLMIDQESCAELDATRHREVAAVLFMRYVEPGLDLPSSCHLSQRPRNQRNSTILAHEAGAREDRKSFLVEALRTARTQPDTRAVCSALQRPLRCSERRASVPYQAGRVRVDKCTPPYGQDKQHPGAAREAAQRHTHLGKTWLKVLLERLRDIGCPLPSLGTDSASLRRPKQKSMPH